MAAANKPKAKAKAKPAAAPAKPPAASAPARAKPLRVPFPKKNQPPAEVEFVARLPLATGNKFEAIRSFLKKQKGVVEDLYYYGPKTGWAYRYVRAGHSVATVMIHDDRLVGIASFDAAALAGVDFASLSDVGRRARKLAHGSPSLSWLDLPLDGAGAADFKTLLKAKLKALAALPPPPLPSAPPSPPRSAPPPPPPPPLAPRKK